MSESNHMRQVHARVGWRLQHALDKAGYPVSGVERAKLLARQLDIDMTAVNMLLSGLCIPDYGLLFKICDLTSCQPGYFLDDTDPRDEMRGMRLVRPLTSGGSMVIRFPNDIRSDSGIKRTTRLWYYLAPEPMALGIRPRDYVITMASAEGKPPVLKGRSYLIGDSDGYSISTCTEIGNERAVFKREDGDQRASIIPVKDNEPVFDDQIVHHFGVLMSILRGHNEIRSSSAVLQA